jgi:hypothetical protein
MKQPPVSHEASFVQAFIDKHYKDRWLMLLNKPKRRDDFLAELHGTGDGDALDERYFERIPSSWTSEIILARLKELGAGPRCYVFSSDTSLDRKEMSVEEAVSEVLGHQMGSVISCRPGRLAYWEAEGPDDRVICHRR